MHDTRESGGVVLDRRLVPAGLTGLLGGYGEGRGRVLGIALALLVCAQLALVLLGWSPVIIGLALIVPVVLVAAEFGMRAGLLCAAGATGMLLVWALSGEGNGPDVVAILARSLALFFLAWAVGRISERAARSRRLLEHIIESTSDSIYVKDLENRYLLVNSAAAQLIGRPGSEILGLTNTALLPSTAGEVGEHEARVLDSETPQSYEISGEYGSGQRSLSVTKSPFRDFAGTIIGTLGIARDITGQRQLQAESTRFFDLSGDMLCTVGFDGIIHRLNGEWEKMLGWSAEELLGRSIFDYMSATDHRAATHAARAARVPNGPGAHLTTSFRAKDGSWHWIDWSLRTVDGEQRVYASARDVTQRRRAERALARSESRYRALVHGLPGTAVLVLDHHLRAEFAAGQALAVGGYHAEELIGRHVSTMFAEPGGAQLTDACEAALRGEERNFDAVFAGDGHEMWARTRPLRGEAGQIAGAMLIAQDVHERIERERAFCEAQERFRRAFDDAPIGMAVTDLQGRFLEVNQALCAITGQPAEELCCTTRMAITHPDDVGADVEAMRAMLAGTRSCHVVEKRYIRPDGETVWVSVNVTVIRDPNGAPLNFLIQVQDVTDRRRFEQELRHLADHDPLTGLFNRRRFEQELERQVSEVARYGPRGAVLVLDLDHFKYVNDGMGHHAGDELILSVAALLQSRLRGSDILARLGGDEFAVLLPTASPGEAEHVAGELLRAVRADAAPVGAGRRGAGVTTSIGVAAFRGAEMTGEELLIEADLAMYDAKEAGRDRFTVVAPEAERPDRIKTRVSWLERIRSALQDDRFVLYAQPIRDLRTGEIRQQELLIRMLDDNGELIPPAAFLPLAERFGLAPAIDRWVAGRALELLAADPGGAQSLEVNLSGPSLNDEQLLNLIEAEVARLGVDPRRLIFEITETSAVANIPLARRFAERLMALGCRFALDDFGAGFGSFYYLKHLPFDYLKIDGEFISGCLESRTDQLIIESVVRIARGLGKETIAEFVADKSLESFLRSQGVDHAQGFYIGRPAAVQQMRRRQPSRTSSE